MVGKNKSGQLEQIKAEIIENNICRDLAESATNLVMGDGDPDAEIVFIGEAPGKNEDMQARPFVGAAGKFLDEMLNRAGLTRKQVYITNIVKYRPLGNRDPLPAEKKAFWPYLVRELGIIRPKIIVTLGRHSMEYFLPNQKITAVHGVPQKIGANYTASSVGGQGDTIAAVLLPLYHPAAALYNRQLRQTLIDDFMTVPEIIKQLKKS